MQLINKLPAQDCVSNGLNVAADGYVFMIRRSCFGFNVHSLFAVAVAGAGKGVDVLHEDGTLLVRVLTNFIVHAKGKTVLCG